MPGPSDMSAYLDVVAALTKVNSDHLLAMGRKGGAEIELTRALEDLAARGAKTDDAEVATLRARLEAAEDALLAMEAERARLSEALARLGQGGSA